MRTLRLIAVLAIVLGACPAWAELKAQVFPLASTDLPAALAPVPAGLTKALAASINATVANVPIEDAAGLMECDPEAAACLAAVSKSVGAERLVFGTISFVSENTLKVTLTRFDPGPDRQQLTFEITGATPDALGKELVRLARPLFGKPAPKQPQPVPDPPPTPPAPVETSGKVSSSTWALVGGGVAIAATGVGLLISARSIRDQVDAAPRDTASDFERLTALEDKGRLRTNIGNALAIGGGVVFVIGVVRAVIQKKSSTTETRSARLQPIPIEGGAAIVLVVTR